MCYLFILFYRYKYKLSKKIKTMSSIKPSTSPINEILATVAGADTITPVENKATVNTKPTKLKNRSNKVVKTNLPASSKLARKKIAHPSFIAMISDALINLADSRGSSRQAIVKFIVNNYKLEEKFVNQHTKIVLKNGVKSGNLKQSKGVGASGSFKLGDKLKLKAKNTLKKAASKQKSAVKPLPGKKMVKVTITKAKKSISVKRSAEIKPKRNLNKVFEVVAKKSIKRRPAISKIEQAKKLNKRTAQSVKVQIQLKKAATKKPVTSKPNAKKSNLKRI